MALMAGMELPVRAIREQMASAFDVIVHQARFKDGSRLITCVSEVVGMADGGDTVDLNDLYVFDHSPGYDDSGRPLGHLGSTALLPGFIDKLAVAGIQLDPSVLEHVNNAGNGHLTYGDANHTEDYPS
jgi:pilus assembly protein CpaF